ncbi:MAG: DNA gyrase subunit A [Candidatus Pacearchaeota archaeon]
MEKDKKDEKNENNMNSDNNKNGHVAEISEEVSKAYIDYAMSVIVARALPSVEDGLKPVQRRILYSMYEMGLLPEKPTKKTARIVGECLGKLHPHGDIAVYDALVRMAQDFSLRYPLIIGQGNFGSIDGDAPAAMRYTEAKLSKIAVELLKDLDKETVPFMPNFDNSMKEPVVLPAKLPNLLINGSQGIAVGMATSIPPHNLTEVVDAIIAYIKNSQISINELLDYIKGPDFPTGGIIFTQGMKEMYEKGVGKIIMRGVVSSEEKAGKKYVIIKELPYQVNKSILIQEIAKLIETKKLPDVSDLRDESTKAGIRIVLQLKKEANEKLIINRLYNYTSLETSFNAIFVALVSGIPKLLNLKDAIEYYVKHRKEVVKRRTRYELEVATERKHILDGFIIALGVIDKVIETIKKADSVTVAEKLLISNFGLTKKQAQAILDLKLSRLTKLEQERIQEEKQQLERKISELSEILKSEQNILKVIEEELREIKNKYGDERKTKIMAEKKEIREIELIKKEDIVLTLSYRGYINAISIEEFREQKRGGKGIIGTMLTENDYINKIIACSTHDNILFITNRGNAFLLRAYEIQKSSRYGKGKHISNLLAIKPEERLKAVIVMKAKAEKGEAKGGRQFLLIVTRKGIIKKTSLEEFRNIKKSGIRAIKLPFDDEIVEAFVLEKDSEIIIATAQGMAVRFNSSEVREMGRAAYGVTAVKLKNDQVADMTIVEPGSQLLTVTSKGYGKKTPIEEYRLTKRAAIGVKNISLSEKTGKVVCIKTILGNESIILITKQGIIIRFNAKDIRSMSRIAQGVRIIKLKSDDEVIDVDVIKTEPTTLNNSNSS